MKISLIYILITVSIISINSSFAKEKEIELVEPFFNSFPFGINYTLMETKDHPYSGNWTYLTLKRINENEAQNNVSDYLMIESHYNVDGKSIFYYAENSDYSGNASIYLHPNSDTIRFYSTGKSTLSSNDSLLYFSPVFKKYANLINNYNKTKSKYDLMMLGIKFELSAFVIYSGATTLLLTSSKKSEREIGFLLVGIGIYAVIYDIIEYKKLAPERKRYRDARNELLNWDESKTINVADSLYSNSQ